MQTFRRMANVSNICFLISLCLVFSDAFPYLSYWQFYLPQVRVYSMGSKWKGDWHYFCKKDLMCLIFVQMSISDVSCGVFVSSILRYFTSGRDCWWRQSSNWTISIHCELFSCPEQLNRWPCHSVTHWLTDWLRVFYWLTYKEWPMRLLTFETFDQSDEETWPDQEKDNDKDKCKDKDSATPPL